MTWIMVIYHQIGIVAYDHHKLVKYDESRYKLLNNGTEPRSDRIDSLFQIIKLVPRDAPKQIYNMKLTL